MFGCTSGDTPGTCSATQMALQPHRPDDILKEQGRKSVPWSDACGRGGLWEHFVLLVPCMTLLGTRSVGVTPVLQAAQLQLACNAAGVPCTAEAPFINCQPERASTTGLPQAKTHSHFSKFTLKISRTLNNRGATPVITPTCNVGGLC